MNPDNEQSFNQTPDMTPTPQPVPPPTSQPPMQTTPQGNDPGKTLAIVGLVLGFIGLSLIGLILSIVAKTKSSKAGFKNTVALVGIILNSIFMILSVVIVIPMILITYGALQGTSRDLATFSELNQLDKGVLSYIQEKNAIPKSLSDVVSNVKGLDQSYLTDSQGKAYTLTWSPSGCDTLSTCEAYTVSGDSAKHVGEKVSISYSALTGKTTYVNKPTSSTSK